MQATGLLDPSLDAGSASQQDVTESKVAFRTYARIMPVRDPYKI
jgi:hypothetical protein